MRFSIYSFTGQFVGMSQPLYVSRKMTKNLTKSMSKLRPQDDRFSSSKPLTIPPNVYLNPNKIQTPRRPITRALLLHKIDPTWANTTLSSSAASLTRTVLVGYFLFLL